MLQFPKIWPKFVELSPNFQISKAMILHSLVSRFPTITSSPEKQNQDSTEGGLPAQPTGVQQDPRTWWEKRCSVERRVLGRALASQPHLSVAAQAAAQRSCQSAFISPTGRCMRGGDSGGRRLARGLFLRPVRGEEIC